VGDSWPDWRTGDQAILRDQLDWPVRGILFDVEQYAFWHPDWGTRPSVTTEALAIGEERLLEAPPLAPLYGHRYLPTVPHEPGNAVLSVYQTDIIHYGNYLLDWLEDEFRRTSTASTAPRGVPFWSWFVAAHRCPPRALARRLTRPTRNRRFSTRARIAVHSNEPR
jgi:hypothetical protein